jgi:hypothetical protein
LNILRFTIVALPYLDFFVRHSSFVLSGQGY